MLYNQPLGLVLDLDGTLIDSRLDIAATVNHALLGTNRRALPVEVITGFIGDGALALMQRATGLAADDDELMRLHLMFRDYYAEHANVHTKPYPGVRSTLESLLLIRADSNQTLRLAVCTNKPKPATTAVLRDLDLERYFDAVQAADDTTRLKPHPEPLLRIAHEWNIAPGAMVMVGDGPQDIECGRRAGAVTVGVTYGMRTEQEVRQAQPDFLANTFPELLELLKLRNS